VNDRSWVEMNTAKQRLASATLSRSIVLFSPTTADSLHLSIHHRYRMLNLISCPCSPPLLNPSHPNTLHRHLQAHNFLLAPITVSSITQVRNSSPSHNSTMCPTPNMDTLHRIHNNNTHFFPPFSAFSPLNPNIISLQLPSSWKYNVSSHYISTI
jgi:hypothetical protein